ncbi:MAG: 3-hydroxyacyl-ACP dehydratase FabZ [Acidobacteriota bacterium]
MPDIREIMRILPHRYPFLLIDRVIELVPGQRIVAIKNVTINEPFFAGHFPGMPVMPGVLLLEAMAQAGAVLALKHGANADRIMYLAGIDQAKFRRPVTPGDQLRIEADMVRYKVRIMKLKGRVLVDGVVVAQAEILSTMGSERQE